MAEALINKLRGHYRICLYTGLRLTSFMLQLLLALGSGHGRGRLAAAAALPPVAVRPWDAGLRALGGRLWLQLPFSRTYFPS
jgi:hypothetical protein